MSEKIDGMSMDIEATNLEKLKSLFPECVSEGKLDIDKLLSLCGEYIDNDFEKYSFSWKGKAECLRLAQKRSTGTLRPCESESAGKDGTPGKFDSDNLYIEGDNLEVLKLLQTAYYRRVKMIYIDPPYNTGNDFVYEDDFADPINKYKEVTSQTTKSNPETMGRYHTNWLNMMYPRLRLAANLLRDDGVIFISIDDNEVFNLKKICDETFGEENFAAQIPWRKRTAKSDVPFGVSQDYEWVLCYAKSESFSACLEGGTRKYFETEDLPGRPWRIHDLTTQRSAQERPNSFFDLVNPKTGERYPANPIRTWAVTKETFEQYYAENRIVFPGDYEFLNISKPAFRYFKEDDMEKAGDKFGFIPVSTKLPEDIGMTQDGTKEITEMFDNKIFGYPKPLALLKHLIKSATVANPQNDDIILDFFSGSATTAHAVMQLNAEDGGNRKYIMVQLPEVCDEKSEAYKAGYKNICEIGKERIRRAGAKIRAEQEEKLKSRSCKLDEERAEVVSARTLRTQTNEAVSVTKYNAANPTFDTGFKVYKLDTSNLVTWDSAPIENHDIMTLFNRLNAMTNSVKPDRTEMDVVAEIMLKMGVPLDIPVTKIDVNGKAAYAVGDYLLLICLAENITAEDMEKLCDLAPGKLVIAESSFADTSAMRNANYIVRDRSVSLKLI